MRFFFWLTARGVIGAAVERNFLNSSYFVRKGPDQSKYLQSFEIHNPTMGAIISKTKTIFVNAKILIL